MQPRGKRLFNQLSLMQAASREVAGRPWPHRKREGWAPASHQTRKRQAAASPAMPNSPTRMPGDARLCSSRVPGRGEQEGEGRTWQHGKGQDTATGGTGCRMWLGRPPQWC